MQTESGQNKKETNENKFIRVYSAAEKGEHSHLDFAHNHLNLSTKLLAICFADFEIVGNF